MKGSVVNFVTALLTFLAVAWQGYIEYEKMHPKPAPAVNSQGAPSASVTPIYWNDGQTWWCQVGDKRYVWRPNTERVAWQQPQITMR